MTDSMRKIEILARLTGGTLEQAHTLHLVLQGITMLGPEFFANAQRGLERLDTVGPLLDPTAYRAALDKPDWQLMRDEILPGLRRAADAIEGQLQERDPDALALMRARSTTGE